MFKRKFKKAYNKRSRILRTVRNISITVAILLTLFIGSGVIYVLVTGRSNHAVKSEIKPEDADTAPDTAPLKPLKPSPNAVESAAVESIYSPVPAGSNSSIYVKTNAGSACTIVVTYNNVPSKDSGLQPKIADDYGVVSWTWTVESTVPVGKWPIKVTCTYNKKSAVVQSEIVVTKNNPTE